MTPDYLDLLLDRATGVLPLAEPRIAPATLGASTSPVWEEIAEETFQPYTASPATPQPETQPLRNTIQSQHPVSAEPRPVLEKPQNPEMPPALPRSEQRTALSPNPTSDSSQPTVHRGVAPAPREPGTASPRVIPDRDERRAFTHDAPPPNPSIRTANKGVELPQSNKVTEKTTERTIQTQRWFPVASATNLANNSDRLMPAPPTPTQPRESAPISIRIERIEVRAGGPAPSSIAAPKPRPSAPLGLDEYLKRKSGGDR